MEEIETESCGEDNESENLKNDVGKENFRMYYALGPEVEQGNNIDFEGSDFTNRKFEYFTTSDIEEDSDANVMNFDKEQQSRDIRDDVDVKDEELSDDSRTDKEWNGSSIPPDVVASANHFKVIKVEPTKIQSNFDSDFVKSLELFKTQSDQDTTDFRRHQVEAYTNLEDLLDEPWEESDFATPSKVDVVLRVGGELGERYGNMGTQGRRKMREIQKAGLDPAQYQCGPLCNNCSIM